MFRLAGETLAKSNLNPNAKEFTPRGLLGRYLSQELGERTKDQRTSYRQDKDILSDFLYSDKDRMSKVCEKSRGLTVNAMCFTAALSEIPFRAYKVGFFLIL